MPGARVFASPSRYLQGPGALDRLGELLAPFGSVPIVVTDAPVLALLGGRIRTVLAGAGLEPHVLTLDGEITHDAVDALAGACAGLDASLVVGIGGGKSLDAAKSVALRLELPVVTVPTIASNDSPTSSAIAMYDDAHALIAVDHLPSNPVLVLVDTALIAAAPADFLRAGIGDAIAKRFEADGCAVGTGLTPLGTRPLGIATAIGDRCYDVLRSHAVQAVADCESGVVTDALERTVEAVVLMSGLAFENGGLSVAHSLTRGLMRVEGARTLPHGYHVAWGALVQLAAEGRPDGEIEDLIVFLRAVGLPVSSAGLGLHQPVSDVFAQIAVHTMTAPHLANFPVPVTEQLIVDAARRVDALAGD